LQRLLAGTQQHGEVALERQPPDRQPGTPERQAPFAASVEAHTTGGWVTTLDLGEGMSLTKWFADQRAAERYGDELAAWLTERTPLDD
jgi:hypothetical protein